MWSLADSERGLLGRENGPTGLYFLVGPRDCRCLADLGCLRLDYFQYLGSPSVDLKLPEARDRRLVTILVSGTSQTQLTPVPSLSALPPSSVAWLPSPGPSLIVRCFVALGMSSFGCRLLLREYPSTILNKISTSLVSNLVSCWSRSRIMIARFFLAKSKEVFWLASTSTCIVVACIPPRWYISSITLYAPWGQAFLICKSRLCVCLMILRPHSRRSLTRFLL